MPAGGARVQSRGGVPAGGAGSSPEGACQRVEPGPVQRGRASGWSRVQSRGGVPAGGAGSSPEGVCQRVEPGPVQRGRASGWSRVQSRAGVPAGGAGVRSRGGVPAGGAGSGPEGACQRVEPGPVQRGRASGWSRVQSRKEETNGATCDCIASAQCERNFSSSGSVGRPCQPAITSTKLSELYTRRDHVSLGLFGPYSELSTETCIQ